MRELVVSQAPVSRIAQIVREIVEEEGGIVANQTTRETEFDHLRLGDENWSRSGYVGTYQRYKEKPVHLRIRVWARWPRRLLLWSIYLGFSVASVFLLLSLVEFPPPPNAWILSAAVFFGLIAITLLLYTSSRPDTRHVEAELSRRLTERIEADEEIPGSVYGVDEYEKMREELIDEAVAEAKEELPHGGSRVKRVLASVGGTKTETVEDGSAEEDEPTEEESSSLRDRLPFGALDEEDDEEPEEPDEEALEEQDEEADKDDENEPSSFTDRLPFVGSSEDDDEEPDEEALEEQEDEDAEEDEGSSFTDRIPFLGSSDDEDEQSAEDPEEEDLQAEDDEEESSSFADRIPFLGGDEEDEEPAGEAEADAEHEEQADDAAADEPDEAPDEAALDHGDGEEATPEEDEETARSEG